MSSHNGPPTGDLAMRENVISAKELIEMRDALNGESTDSRPVRDTIRTKHKRPSLRVGLESEEGKTYLAITDHDTGHRATIQLSLESMASLGAQMLTASAGEGIQLGCWLEGELEVAK